MALEPVLPRPTVALIDSRGFADRDWYEFFRLLRGFAGDNIDVQSQITALEQRILELEEAEGEFPQLRGVGSIRIVGSLADALVQFFLDGDVAEPGNTYYYGTGPDGLKGFFAISSAVLGDDSVIQDVGADGISTFHLDGDVLAPGSLFNYATNMAGDKGWYRPAMFESSGLLHGGALSINADPTKFDVAASIVGYTDYSLDSAAPTRSVAQYGPTTANDVDSLAVIATFIGIQTPGGTLVQQSSPFTATQRRTIVQLGAVISNGTQLIAVNNLPGVMRAGINQIQDLMEALGPINRSGNVFGPNGSNLQLNKSAGTLFKQGANFVTNEDDPHNLDLASLTAFTFAYRTSTGVQAANTTSVDVTQYESAPGVLSTVPNNRFTIQRINLFTSNLVRIQYGQTVYDTMAEAEAALSTEAFNTEANIAENGVLRAFLILEKDATALDDPTQAKFVPATKFGGPLGSGGTSITNTDSLPEGITNLYFTDARAQAAVVAASIVNGDTAHSPSGDAVFDALALKANLDSPALTGNPTAPTPTPGDNDTSIATTAFVTTAVAAVVIDSIADADTTHAPSRNAVFDALALKQDTISAGTTAQFYRGDKVFSNELTGAILLTIEGAGIGQTLTKYSNDAAAFQLRYQKARGTIASPAAVTTNDTLCTFQARGNFATAGTPTAFSGNVGAFDIIAAEPFTNTAQGTAAELSLVPIGSTTRSIQYQFLTTAFQPATDNTHTLGGASLRWNAIHTFQQHTHGAQFDTGVVSPAALAANTDNWAITGIGTAKVVRASASGASRNVTGIASPTAGQRILLANVGSFDLVLVHDATSTAANRFLCPGGVNLTLNPNDSAWIWYDSTSSRWRVLGF